MVTVEVTSRVKGLDLIDRVPEELWIEVHDIVQEAVIKTIPKKKKCKKAKWLFEEALQIAEKRSERQRRKGKIYPSESTPTPNQFHQFGLKEIYLLLISQSHPPLPPSSSPSLCGSHPSHQDLPWTWSPCLLFLRTSQPSLSFGWSDLSHW